MNILDMSIHDAIVMNHQKNNTLNKKDINKLLELKSKFPKIFAKRKNKNIIRLITNNFK